MSMTGLWPTQRCLNRPKKKLTEQGQLIMEKFQKRTPFDQGELARNRPTGGFAPWISIDRHYLTGLSKVDEAKRN